MAIQQEHNEKKTDGTNRINCSGHVPIAICGMGMRYPGGIHDPEALYNFLLNKNDARAPLGQKRYNIAGYHSPHSKPGTVPTDHGYLLSSDLAKFDASMFPMGHSEIEKMDPQQRLLLEVVYEALESAGEKSWQGKNIGCYVGNFGEDWLDLHGKDVTDAGLYRIAGYMDFSLASRISYEYDLRGPRYVDSSSPSLSRKT